MIKVSANSLGISEVIAYILVFSVITVTIGVVYATGYAQLQEQRAIEKDENVERALEILMSNNGEVLQGQAPSRSTEVKLLDSKLSAREDTSEMYIEVPATGDTFRSPSDVMVYDSERRSYEYEFNALIRKSKISEDRSARIIDQPDTLQYEQESNTLLIQSVSMIHKGSQVSGGVREIRTKRVDRNIYNIETGSNFDVYITITSDNVLLWDKYFESKDVIETCDAIDTRTIECVTVPLSEVIINQTDIRMEYV